MALEYRSPYQRLHHCEDANYSCRNLQAMIYIMFFPAPGSGFFAGAPPKAQYGTEARRFE